MRRAGVYILIRTDWFTRSNVTAGIAQQAACCAAQGRAHGAGCLADRPGRGAWRAGRNRHNSPVVRWGLEDGTRSITWRSKARAARPARFPGAVYGAIGGRCLEMLPMSLDETSCAGYRRMHVDPVEQWTLIHRAQAVPAARKAAGGKMARVIQAHRLRAAGARAVGAVGRAGGPVRGTRLEFRGHPVSAGFD